MLSLLGGRRNPLDFLIATIFTKFLSNEFSGSAAISNPNNLDIGQQEDLALQDG
jgi:hypothetical protein